MSDIQESTSNHGCFAYLYEHGKLAVVCDTYNSFKGIWLCSLFGNSQLYVAVDG